MPETILIVDDESAGHLTASILENKLGYNVVRSRSSQEAMRHLRGAKAINPDLLMIDMEALGSEPEATIRNFKITKPELPIIILLPYGDEGASTKAIYAGAQDFLCKPVATQRLSLTIQLALKMQRMGQYISWLKRRAAGHVDFSDIVGKAPVFMEAQKTAQLAASSKMPVWIEGEIGVGKELFARAIHGASTRAAKPFIVVNCETLSEQRAQALLFGQMKRNLHDKLYYAPGKLQEADGGTLLLEEVGALSPQVQKQLLHMLETDTIISQDTQQPSRIDVRIISTTSASLDSMASRERFNHALYQRLKAVAITLPPLRERREDIVPLADHFLVQYCAMEHKYVRGLSLQAWECLKNNAWPGNVHELASTLWRAVVLCDDETIDIADLKISNIRKNHGDGTGTVDTSLAPAALLDERGKIKPLKSLQEEAIRFALEYSGGCMARAAKNLGIGRSTLYRKIREIERSSNYTSRANQTTRPITTVSSVDRS